MAFDSKMRILYTSRRALCALQTSLVCRLEDTLFKRGRSLFSRQIRKWWDFSHFSLSSFQGKLLIFDSLNLIPQSELHKRDLHVKIYILTEHFEVNR
jgi:hypothetical protein